MAKRFQAPKGTRDLLPPATALWAKVESIARAVFSLYGYGEIRTPIFEDAELFQRGVGESSDIVTKEMYTFLDRSGRSLTLRPENTASVCRAFVEHGLQQSPKPVRLFYIGPQFRYERPQKGRYRQFSQIGAEVFGGKALDSDVEILLVLVRFLRELGFVDLVVHLNTVGDQASRAAFRTALLNYLQPSISQLGEDSRKRLESNPLRILDSKNPEEQTLLSGAPSLSDYLTPDSRKHFDAVKSSLQTLGVPFEVNPRLVRGLDYYTNTVFEVVSEGLGAQNAICGGGAYDGLVQELGGPATYGVGFAIGEDRLIEVLPEESRARSYRAQPVQVELMGSLRRDPTRGRTLQLQLLERLRGMRIPAVEARAATAADALAGMSWTRVFFGDEEAADGTISIQWIGGETERGLDLEVGLSRLARLFEVPPQK